MKQPVYIGNDTYINVFDVVERNGKIYVAIMYGDEIKE